MLLAAPAVFVVMVAHVAADQDARASEALAFYVRFALAPLSWIVVSILSASAISGEANVIADSILSKSVTRSEYMWAKITARLGVFLGVYLLITVPLAYLLARYASTNDTSPGGLAGGLAMVAMLFAFLGALGIALSAMFRNVQLAVVGVLLVAVVSGVVLQFLGLSSMSATAIIDELPGDLPRRDRPGRPAPCRRRLRSPHHGRHRLRRLVLPPEGPVSLLSGAGLLYTTELHYADLGTHHGRRLRGRVERRLVRLALGDGSGLRLQLGRLRPVAVEVIDPDDRRYEIAIPTPPEPRLVAARRTLLCWLVAALVIDVARRLRAKEPA